MDAETLSQLHKAIRNLVDAIYNDCYGVFGIDRGYEGECEPEIQKIIDILRNKEED